MATYHNFVWNVRGNGAAKNSKVGSRLTGLDIIIVALLETRVKEVNFCKERNLAQNGVDVFRKFSNLNYYRFTC